MRQCHHAAGAHVYWLWRAVTSRQISFSKVAASSCPAHATAFVDVDMHLESTKLWVDEFVRAVLPHGTTAVAADPHEIANVFGVPGIVALAEASGKLPFTFR